MCSKERKCNGWTQEAPQVVLQENISDDLIVIDTEEGVRSCSVHHVTVHCARYCEQKIPLPAASMSHASPFRPVNNDVLGNISKLSKQPRQPIDDKRYEPGIKS